MILLVQDLQIGIVNAATGELLRELILDYQPTGAPKGPRNEQHPDLHSQVRVSPMS